MSFLNNLSKKGESYYEQLKPLFKEGLIREAYSDENYSVIVLAERFYFLSNRELKVDNYYMFFIAPVSDIIESIEKGSDGLREVFAKYNRKSLAENVLVFDNRTIKLIRDASKYPNGFSESTNVPDAIDFENRLKEIMISKGIDPSILKGNVDNTNIIDINQGRSR